MSRKLRTFNRDRHHSFPVCLFVCLFRFFLFFFLSWPFRFGVPGRAHVGSIFSLCLAVSLRVHICASYACLYSGKVSSTMKARLLLLLLFLVVGRVLSLSPFFGPFSFFVFSSPFRSSLSVFSPLFLLFCLFLFLVPSACSVHFSSAFCVVYLVCLFPFSAKSASISPSLLFLYI